jgi:lipoyl(octanoyl) transferase
MDVTPFDAIDPCGYKGLEVTQTRDLGITDDMATIAEKLLNRL